MRRADIDDEVKPGTTSQKNAELRETRRRIKLLEQENEVLHRAAVVLGGDGLAAFAAGGCTFTCRRHICWETDLLARERAGRGGCSRTVTCQVRTLARQPYYRCLERPVSDAEFEEADRAIALSDAEEPEFGYRLLADEARNSGWDMADRGSLS
ncbi:hypothetical protein ACIHCV_43565 [Streptomyces sp. NPDC051956]|uniref:hypothetical protein n=1 Tax=Streptomyces sp. NPDC051956 TaxID=3365677 RepID=UPI0037D6E19A